MKIYYFILTAIAALLFTACDSGQEIPDTGGSEFITVDLSLTPDASLLRSTVVGLPEDKNADNYYDYIWNVADKQKVYVFFKSGTTTGVSSVEFNVPTGYHPINNPLPIKIKIPKPAAFSTLTNFEISGAMGVTGMDANGACTITPPTTIDGGNKKYNLPFYFSFTPVKNNQAEINFKTYGSLLRVELMHNSTITGTTTWNNLNLKTTVISTKGSFNVNTTDAIPKWTRDKSTELREQVGTSEYYTYATNSSYTLSGVSTTKDTKNKAVIYVWGVPNPDFPSSNPSAYDREIWVTANNSVGQHLSFASTITNWNHRKTYTMQVVPKIYP